VTQVLIAHTAQLTPRELSSVLTLLDEAFDGEFSDQDYDHTLGGMHALLWDGSTLIGHGAVIMRRLLHREPSNPGGRSLRTGYVEGVAVCADHRGHGHGHTVMAALKEIIGTGYQIGAEQLRIRNGLLSLPRLAGLVRHGVGHDSGRAHALPSR